MPPPGAPPSEAGDEADPLTPQAVAVVEQALDQVEGSVERAERAELGAEAAQVGAEQARDAAVQAGQGAVDAAEVVAPDDPAVDVARRRIEAHADDANPFGLPGRALSKRSPFFVGFTASLGVALAYGLVNALVAVRSVLILLLTAAFLAIGLNPAVEALTRRRVTRGRSVGIVLLAVLLLFVGFGFALVPPVIEQGQAFVDQLPRYLSQLQDNERVASVDERFGLLARAETLLDDPGQLGVSAAGGVLGFGRIVFSAFFGALTVLIVTLYFLSSLPTIKASAYGLIPRSRRARVGLLTDEILSRVGGYVAGALAIASLAGVTTFVLLVMLGIDYPVALAMLVALTGLIPLIGATIGAVVVVTVALFTSVQVGIICAVWYLIYQQVENYVVYPRVMQRSVDVSPAATVVAVLVGGSLLGVLGALLAIPIAAAVQLVLKEVVGPRQDRT